MVAMLPTEFVALAPFVADWALTTEKARHDKLTATGIPELRAFYDAMLPRWDAIVAYLNQFPLGKMPPEASTLFDLSMTFAESAHPIDLNWRTTDIEDKFPAERFIFVGPSAA
jgi:hypothetical protein